MASGVVASGGVAGGMVVVVVVAVEGTGVGVVTVGVGVGVGVGVVTGEGVAITATAGSTPAAPVMRMASPSGMRFPSWYATTKASRYPLSRT